MEKIDADTREKAIALFTKECAKLEKMISKRREVTPEDLKRVVELADSAVYEEFGFHIRDFFV